MSIRARAARADAPETGAYVAQLFEQHGRMVYALCRLLLRDGLAELPQTQREAVILREFYGLSYREVAAALDLSGPAVESVLFKSRRKLQDKLRPLRAASNALVLPLTVHEALETAIPGFSQSAGAGAAAGTLALPAVAKV